MVLERTEEEILIRMPANTDLSEIQNMIDYMQYVELSATSEATQDDADKLARISNVNIWEKFKRERAYK